MQIRPTAFTIGLIIHPSIALFCVYTEFGIDSKQPEGCSLSISPIQLSHPNQLKETEINNSIQIIIIFLSG